MMGESIDVWREFFRTTDTNMFEFIDKAITIVALDCPKDFLSQRDRIAERLFSYQITEAGGDCTLKSKESKANSDSRGSASCDVVSVICSHGEAETLSDDDIKGTSQIVGEVLRIKRVLDNSRHKSDMMLHESLRKLQSMSITVDILEKTKIGISVNSLRKNCGSKQIAQLAHNITMRWKAMVEQICRGTVDVADTHKIEDGTTCSGKGQNIRNLGGSLARRKRKLNVSQQPDTVKPNMSSNTNSRTTPSKEYASKDRMLRSRDSKGLVVGCKRPLACGQDVIKCWNEVVADMKFTATQRKMQGLYQKAEADKRQRTVQVLDPRDLPKMAASHKAPRATAKDAWRRG